MNAAARYFVRAMAEENSEIARGLRRRDPDLLDRLIEQYQHRLLRYLLHLTGNPAMAEDLFQETWVRVLERGNQYDGRHEFCTWLFAVARHLFIDSTRRKQHASLDGMLDDDDRPIAIPATGQPSAFDLTVQRELSEHVADGLTHLVAEYREALVLRFQEGLTLEEISVVTGAPLGTVKSRIYRGLNALQPYLKGAQA
jgi:RNA polymerase sigma-70 factor (ECF subfamily)